MIELALYQPDIPQNTGTLMRLCACLDIHLHLIEPLGFVFNEHKMRRAGMDYLDHVHVDRHVNFEHFQKYAAARKKRIILSTTKAEQSLFDHAFSNADIILMGSESSGVPDDVHHAADVRIKIPMKGQMRSLNMAVCASMVLTEAFRQTNI